MKDQIIDMSKLEAAKEIFKSIDKDQDELISTEELHLYFKILGHSFLVDDVHKLIEDSNPVYQGYLSKWIFIVIKDFDEFYFLLNSLKKEEKLEEENLMKDAFYALGGNESQSSAININNIAKLIQQDFGLNIDVKKLLNEDFSNDNPTSYISFDQFKEFLFK